MRTLIAAVILLVMPLAAGCATRYNYPESVKLVAIGSCEQGGGPAPYCECLVHWLEDNVPYDQFSYTDYQLQRGGAIPASWYVGINSCR